MVNIIQALKQYGLGHIKGSRNDEHRAADLTRGQLIFDGHYSSEELPTVPDMILMVEVYKQKLDAVKKV